MNTVEVPHSNNLMIQYMNTMQVCVGLTMEDKAYTTCMAGLGLLLVQMLGLNLLETEMKCDICSELGLNLLETEFWMKPGTHVELGLNLLETEMNPGIYVDHK